MTREEDFARAIALHDAGRLEDAEALYDAIAKAFPQDAAVFAQWALAPLQRGDFAEGLRLLDESLRLAPDQIVVENNRALALSRLGRFDDAIAAHTRVIAKAPNYGEAYEDRGLAFLHQDKPQQASEDLERASTLRPNDPSPWTNWAVVLNDLGRPKESWDAAQHALALAPNWPRAAHCSARALAAMGQKLEALNWFDRAIVLAPNDAHIYDDRASVLLGLARMEEALASYEQAWRCDPTIDLLAGHLLFCRLSLCDWRSFDRDVSAVLAAIDAGMLPAQPFSLLSVPASPAQQHRLSIKFAKRYQPAAALPAYPKRDKIRLGYFSPEIRDHATFYLLAELIERHDRDRFHVSAFSYGRPVRDAMRQRMEEGFDAFHDVYERSDQEIVALAHASEIDIAIDLKGYTQDMRPGLFAARLAPLQVSFLGFPGTMGAPFIDYLIADPVLVPPEDRQFYSEKIVALPDTYQPNDSTRIISSRQFALAELGLPEGAFVFCCFNNNFKITPGVFDIWMDLLTQIEGSVLWLFEGNASAAANLRAEAAKRGVAPERLVFAPRMNLADHLARHVHADLFLDTFHCAAHTTASDALWAGLPVLARKGDTFAGRVAASLLHAIGLSELIALTDEEYHALALDLARDRTRLTALKQKLDASRLTTALFDTPRFARHIETAYAQMHQRALAGLAPDHIVISR